MNVPMTVAEQETGPGYDVAYRKASFKERSAAVWEDTREAVRTREYWDETATLGQDWTFQSWRSAGAINAIISDWRPLTNGLPRPPNLAWPPRRPNLTRPTREGFHTIFINDRRFEYPSTQTNLVEICAMHEIQVPVFCYHPKLGVAGNCRMCLVQVSTSINPVVACAMPASPYMDVKTDSRLVRECREGNVELLLINHPLDCPICDQAGECDLQDISFFFGSPTSRFHDTKRAVVDKKIAPFVKTNMNRCIHCTRCVRFLSEIAKDDSLGMIGRGNVCEISTYHNYSQIETELSANIADICPVGALARPPRAISSRPAATPATPESDTAAASLPAAATAAAA